MRLLVAAGASGGGVYPALAVLQELKNEELDLLWLGGEGGMEKELVSRAGYSVSTLPAAGLHGVGWRMLPKNFIKIWQGYWAARELLKEFSPDALFFTGGFVAAPVALAGQRIPTLAFVPDIKPGFTLRFIARFADRIALVSQASKKYFKRAERLHITGYPMRKELAKWKRGVAQAHFGLNSELPTLLVFGGSKGAHSINSALIEILPELLSRMQIIHISGEANWSEVEKLLHSLPKSLAENLRAFPYLHDDMGAAMAAADLVLARAGASTLGEFPIFGLPALLVPISFKNHIQHLNADFLQKRGAALILPDDEMSEKLSQMLISLVENKAQLSEMSAAMRRLARPKAAREIASLLMELADSSQKERQLA